ncbi:MAG: hypothetical protein AAGE59_13355 [Cyanobacteria bacterium P01_F01_bin.86]
MLNRISSIVSFAGYPLSPIEEAIAQKTLDIPEKWAECMPENVTEAQLIGEHEGEFTVYGIWQLGTTRESSFLFVTGLYGGNGGVCGHAFDSRYELYMSPEYIREPDAQALSILLYKHRIDVAGGLANFQALIDETLAEPGPSYFAPEFIYAMRQLGVNLPDGEVQATGPNNEPPRVRQP